MNYHSNEWIMDKVFEHYDEALIKFPRERIVGIFLQGSQNYGLDYENSDVDTKLIVTPSFEDIAMNRQPISTTYIRENGEHIDIKDIRLYMQLFRKQNINIVEILFTPYAVFNGMYMPELKTLLENGEQIARYDEVVAIKAMKGVAMEKYHAMEHRYPSKVELIDKYGYDGKQLSHLYRIKDFLERYINGEDYASCLRPLDPEFLLALKKNEIALAEARMMAAAAITDITNLVDTTIKNMEVKPKNDDIEQLLYKTQYNIMRRSVITELQAANKQI